jgi:hypothetical protein
VDALHAWLRDQDGRVSAASVLAKVIRYAIRHWPGLVVFLDDGRVDDRGGRRHLTPSQLVALDVKEMVDAIQRAVVVP